MGHALTTCWLPVLPYGFRVQEGAPRAEAEASQERPRFSPPWRLFPTRTGVIFISERFLQHTHVLETKLPPNKFLHPEPKPLDSPEAHVSSGLHTLLEMS